MDQVIYVICSYAGHISFPAHHLKKVCDNNIWFPFDGNVHRPTDGAALEILLGPVLAGMSIEYLGTKAMNDCRQES